MRLSSFTYMEKSLGEMIEEADAGKYAIPVFQRGYVWKVNQVEGLGDSIIRGYPIGSLLVMGNGGTLSVASRPLSSSVADIDPQALNLMDGQQRATSLHRLFGDHGGRERFYYDMLSILCEAFPNDRIEGPFLSKFPSKKGVGLDCVCHKFSYSIDEKAPNAGGRFISCQQVMDKKIVRPLKAFIHSLEEVEIDAERLEVYHEYLNGMFSDVGAYKISLVQIAASAPIDLVCRVFEKVNSSGTDLTVSDLLNAKTYGARPNCEGGVVTYVAHSISKSALYGGTAKASINKFFKLNGDTGVFKNLMPIFKIIALAELIEEGQNPEPRVNNSDVMTKVASEWFELWDKYESRVLSFFQWADDVGIFWYTADNVFELFGAMAVGMPEAFKLNEFREALLRYAMGLAISGDIFSHSDYPVICGYIGFGKELLARGSNHRSDVSEPAPIPSLSVEHVYRAGANTKACKAIMSLMYRRNYLGKFSTDLYGNSVKVGDPAFDIHHLVPKASWGRDKDIFDTVANLVYLHVDANRNKLKDAKLREAIDTIKAKHGDDERRYKPIFEGSLVPLNAFDEKAFVRERAKLIWEYVRAFLQERV